MPTRRKRPTRMSSPDCFPAPSPTRRQGLKGATGDRRRSASGDARMPFMHCSSSQYFYRTVHSSY
eukprot:3429108-Prymnesium_polylepis.2